MEKKEEPNLILQAATKNIAKSLTSVIQDTEKLVNQIENYNPNKIPPSLEDARLHKQCQYLGKPVNYQAISSVSPLI